MKVTHIIPATPPEFNGLGDYVRMLHRHWPDSSVEWHVAALRVAPGVEKAWPGVRFHPFEPNASSLMRALEEAGSETVVLHYVPHAYDPKGVPAWLPDALEGWRGRLVTFFHELFAFGPPWKSAWWLSPHSIRVLRRVCRLSDEALTSNGTYAEQLRIYGGSRVAPRVAPIGTNIAVVRRARPYSRGAAVRMAVFGAGPTRTRALSVHAPLLRALMREGSLGQVVLIGSRGDREDVDLARQVADVEEVFDASETGVSEALASCSLGLIATERRRVEKSGVFAAACAHGLLPIVTTPGSCRGPCLVYQRHRPEQALRALKDAETCDRILSEVAMYAEGSSWSTICGLWSHQLRLEAAEPALSG